MPAAVCGGMSTAMADQMPADLGGDRTATKAASAVTLPGGSGEVALLTAIDAALDAAPGELPARVALVRRYVSAALDTIPGNRRATYRVLAHMIIRELNAGDGEQSHGRTST